MWRRRSIFEVLKDLENEMDRITEEFFRKIKEEEFRSNCIMPLYNISEDDKEYKISIDIPGVNKEDINLELQKDKLILDAPCRVKLPRGDRYKLIIELPEAVELDRINARYRNGVLEISIMKKVDRKKILIQ